jgi:hypothetical protein
MSTSENYILKEEKVFIPSTTWFEERAIADLPTEHNQQNLIDALVERFQELVDKVNELQKEFDATSDKIKLAGKVVRTKSYICTAKAIGDYPSLLTVLDKIEAVIKVAVDEVLVQKEKLCNEVEALLETKEWKNATDQLRDLQKAFKDLPTVPDLKNEEFRLRFEKAKDEFFKGKQASFESFELDLLDNLSKKLELCEKAEALQNSGEWKKTTELYQELNEEWKKIGMVPKHRIEELWFRFSTAKDIFFNRKREHIDEIKVEQGGNLEKKLEIVAKAESIKESKDWKKTSEEFVQLMEDWKKIGRVSQDKSDEVWNQFLEAKNHFFQNKDAYYSKIKVQLEDNYARKMSIVNHAEELQHSMDFENATKEFMEMFDEWKTIGRTPKEYGDDAWERFQKAKKNFFDRKDANRDLRKQEMSKDLQERLIRNRGFYNKVNRELQREEELLFDVNDRLQNLPATLRSYEKREELKEMVEEIENKINQLKAKVKDVKEKIFQDEREINYILRGPRKKENTKEQQSKSHKSESSTIKNVVIVNDAPIDETPTTTEVETNDVDMNTATIEQDSTTPVSSPETEITEINVETTPTSINDEMAD